MHQLQNDYKGTKGAEQFFENAGKSSARRQKSTGYMTKVNLFEKEPNFITWPILRCLSLASDQRLRRRPNDPGTF